jgi:hypothetical protein
MGISSTAQFVCENGPEIGNGAERARPRENRASCPFPRAQETRTVFVWRSRDALWEPDSGARVAAHTTDLCLGRLLCRHDECIATKGIFAVVAFKGRMAP